MKQTLKKACSAARNTLHEAGRAGCRYDQDARGRQSLTPSIMDMAI
jgi:hypothetical protein